jgi:hypothetical protein
MITGRLKGDLAHRGEDRGVVVDLGGSVRASGLEPEVELGVNSDLLKRRGGDGEQQSEQVPPPS